MKLAACRCRPLLRAAASLLCLTACGGRVSPERDDCTNPLTPCAGEPVACNDAYCAGPDASPTVDASPPNATTHRDSGTMPPDPADAMSPRDAGPDVGHDASVGCVPGTHSERGGCVPDDPTAGLGSSAPCLGRGNVLHVEADRDAYIFDGTSDITGPWAGSSQAYRSPNDVVLAEVTPNEYPSMWSLTFMSEELNVSLEKNRVYFPTASNYSQSHPPLPNFHLQNGSLACIERSAAFVFDQFEGAPADAGPNEQILKKLTARFWMHCDGHAGLIRGCVHYER